MQTYPATVRGNHYHHGHTTLDQYNSGQPAQHRPTGGFLATSNPPPYSVSQNIFEMTNQQPSSLGFQQNNPSAPPPTYPY